MTFYLKSTYLAVLPLSDCYFTYLSFVLQSVVVRWEPPPDGSQNGIITGYKIRYRKQNERSGETVTTDGSQRVYDITGRLIKTRKLSRHIANIRSY